MATTIVRTIPIVGSTTKWTIRVNGKHAGTVELSKKDGLYVAIYPGKILGRFNHKQDAVDMLSEYVVTKKGNYYA